MGRPLVMVFGLVVLASAGVRPILPMVPSARKQVLSDFLKSGDGLGGDLRHDRLRGYGDSPQTEIVEPGASQAGS